MFSVELTVYSLILRAFLMDVGLLFEEPLFAFAPKSCERWKWVGSSHWTNLMIKEPLKHSSNTFTTLQIIVSTGLTFSSDDHIASAASWFLQHLSNLCKRKVFLLNIMISMTQCTTSYLIEQRRLFSWAQAGLPNVMPRK